MHAKMRSKISTVLPEDSNGHKDVYTLYRELYEQLSDNDESLPAYGLAYAIRRILYPDFLENRVPTLLKLLCGLDAERRRLASTAREILVWQDFYRDDKTCRALTAEEEKAIKKIGSGKKEGYNRFAYSQIVIRWCQMHVYYLYLSPDARLLRTHLPRLFPGLQRGKPDQSSSEPINFHYDFSDEELERLAEAQQKSMTFLSEAKQWDLDREKFWKDHDLPMQRFMEESDEFSYKQEFTAQFPPPQDGNDLIRNTEKYLQKVCDMVDSFEAVFGDERGGI